MTRIGVWLVGARGSVATTAIAGAAAVRVGAAAPTGCVSELPDFADVGLPAWSDLVFGGHDVVDTPLVKRVEQLVHGGVIPARLADLVWTDLTVAEGEIRSGASGDPARLGADMVSFRRRNRLDRVVVVNVATTEAPCPPHPAHHRLSELDRALHTLPPSSLYAYAAMRSGCAYVDFTPSTGAWLPALDELAHVMGVPYAGRDGKTGETLLRSVLAPMFARRALKVLSWSGTNLLGGGDGANLVDPGPAASKTAAKRRVLEGELGGPVDGQVHIDHVAALGDWKTAWDHVLFEGFLGTRMTMQVTWQGCDSALAAPLVLDLARFMATVDTPGQVPELAFFFKDPLGVGPHGLAAQYDVLRAWARPGTVGPT